MVVLAVACIAAEQAVTADSNPAGERFWRETGGVGDGNSISVSSRDFLVALLPGKSQHNDGVYSFSSQQK